MFILQRVKKNKISMASWMSSTPSKSTKKRRIMRIKSTLLTSNLKCEKPSNSIKLIGDLLLCVVPRLTHSKDSILVRYSGEMEAVAKARFLLISQCGLMSVIGSC